MREIKQENDALKARLEAVEKTVALKFPSPLSSPSRGEEIGLVVLGGLALGAVVLARRRRG